MTIKEELYDILCKQLGIELEVLEEYGIEGYFVAGWMGEKDILKAIETLLRKSK